MSDALKSVRVALAGDDLLAALKLMLRDYRTEGCSDPKCGVCKKSNAAEHAALVAINKAGEMLTDKELDEIEARLAAATPWRLGVEKPPYDVQVLVDAMALLAEVRRLRRAQEINAKREAFTSTVHHSPG